MSRVVAIAVICALAGCRSVTTFEPGEDGSYEITASRNTTAEWTQPDGTVVKVDTKKTGVIRDILELVTLRLATTGGNVDVAQ